MSRLDELFDAAQDVQPERRAAWLDIVCAGDDALRRELQRLLHADAHADGILESGRPLICEVLAEEAEAPKAFGVWRVLGSLGVGGMGAVWLAERDDAGFVQRAAIKQVAWPTPGLLQRFRNERQILARLEHPGIARLIDGGVDGDGCPYLAMEYVEGTRVDVWTRERGLDARAIVKLLLQVCDAMQFAHRNLIVHSDIKPSNILVGDDGKPRLLDFGIARVVSEDGVAETRTMTLLLTPDYAAPEWLAGGAPNTAVDIYALGVLAYELLSGGKPYRTRRDGMAATPQLPDTPTRPPSSAMLVGAPNRRARQRALRGDLDRVVMTAMAREPERRYATVEAFATDLRNWLDGRAIAARGDHAWYRLRKFVARNRVAVSAAAVVAVALVVAIAFNVRSANAARAQAARAEAVRLFLADTFAQIDPTAHPGTPISMRELLDQSAQRLTRARDVPLPVRIDLTTMLGTFYWNLADTVVSKRMLQSAVRMAAREGVDDGLRARALLALAQVEQDRGEVINAYDHASTARTLALRDGSSAAVAESAHRLAVGLSMYHDGAVKAEPEIRALLKRDRARYGDDSEAVVKDLILLGQALDTQSRFREAETALTEAVANARKVTGLYKSKLGLALILLGEVRVHRGRYTEAARAFDQCTHFVAQLWGRDSVRASIVRGDLLEVSIGQGHFRESLPVALALRDEARRMQQARPDHYANTLALLGDVYVRLGQLAQAEDTYRKARAQWSVATHGHDTNATAATLSRIAMVLKLQGRLEDAERTYRRAIAIERNVLSPHSQWLAHDLAGLADVLRLRGQVRAAESLSQDAVATLGSRSADASPLSIKVLAWRAQALLDHGEAGRAWQQALDARFMARRILPAGNWQQAPAEYALARAALEIGQTGEAETAARSALALRRPRLPERDPRVLEVEVTLVRALETQGKENEAGALRSKIAPLLAKPGSPYLAGLRRRLRPD